MRSGILIAFAIAALGCQSSYYRPCVRDRECDDDQRCERVDDLLLATEPFCTGTCSTSDDCVERFGPASYCGLVGSCFEACETDADCPNASACTTEGFCAHPTEEP